MSNDIEVLAIIPARGGSRGIPRKNITDICGMPLLGYSILSALGERKVNRTVVSTDCEEIAEVAKSFGAEVPFLRPQKISHDNAQIDDALRHMQEGLAHQGYRPDVICVLYPTHPFRLPGMVDAMIQKIEEGYCNAFTVRPITSVQNRYCTRDADGRISLLRTICPDVDHGTPSPVVWRQYGLVELHRTGARGALRIWRYEVVDPVMLIDIDEPEDLELARSIVKRGDFDFGFNKADQKMGR